MPYVKRDATGAVVAVSRDSTADICEEVPEGSAELAAFLGDGEAGRESIGQVANPGAVDQGVVGNFMASRFCRQGHLAALLPEVHETLMHKPCTRVEGACGSGGMAVSTAANATSLSALVMPVFSAIAATKSAFFRLTTSSFFFAA